MKTSTWSWRPSFGQNHEFLSFKSCTHLDQALNTTNCVCHYHQTIRGQDALSVPHGDILTELLKSFLEKGGLTNERKMEPPWVTAVSIETAVGHDEWMSKV
jgi:hypothetical protein